MTEYSTFIGMDVHKNSIDIATAQSGRKGQVLHYGKINGTLLALDKVVRKLVSRGSRLHFVYEAGPCGYQIYRHLTGRALPARWWRHLGFPKQAATGSKMTAGMH